MRNLLQYPITHDEVIEWLKSEQERVLAEGAVGDMRPLYLDHCIAAIQYRQLKLWERTQDGR